MADEDDILGNILDEKKERLINKATDIPIGNDDENLILLPLLDEIDSLSDNTIKHFVRSVLLKSENFFEPSADGIDSELVIHVKRVFRIAKLLLMAQERSVEEMDLVLAATLVQDVTKLIAIDADGTIAVDPFHPYTVGPFVEMVRSKDDILGVGSASNSLHIDADILEQILRLVRCHQGAFSPVPETIPLTSLEWLLHYSDYLASNIIYILTGEMQV